LLPLLPPLLLLPIVLTTAPELTVKPCAIMLLLLQDTAPRASDRPNAENDTLILGYVLAAAAAAPTAVVLMEARIGVDADVFWQN